MFNSCFKIHCPFLMYVLFAFVVLGFVFLFGFVAVVVLFILLCARVLVVCVCCCWVSYCLLLSFGSSVFCS